MRLFVKNVIVDKYIDEFLAAMPRVFSCYVSAFLSLTNNIRVR